MSPEIIVGVLQFGAMGLLGLAIYFGLQANARMLEVLADALKRCQEDKAKITAEIEAIKLELTNK